MPMLQGLGWEALPTRRLDLDTVLDGWSAQKGQVSL